MNLPSFHFNHRGYDCADFSLYLQSHFFFQTKQKDSSELPELYHQDFSCAAIMFASIPNFSEFYIEQEVNNMGVNSLVMLNEIIHDFDRVRLFDVYWIDNRNIRNNTENENFGNKCIVISKVKKSHHTSKGVVSLRLTRGFIAAHTDSRWANIFVHRKNQNHWMYLHGGCWGDAGDQRFRSEFSRRTIGGICIRHQKANGIYQHELME